MGRLLCTFNEVKTRGFSIPIPGLTIGISYTELPVTKEDGVNPKEYYKILDDSKKLRLLSKSLFTPIE